MVTAWPGMCGDVVTGARLRPERQLVVHGEGGRAAKKVLTHESVTRTVGTVVICGESNLETTGDVLRDVAASVDVYYGVAARTMAARRRLRARWRSCARTSRRLVV